MVVELISVGTELLLGDIVNTNARYLSQQCAKLGLSMYHQSVVGDNPERIAETYKQALSRSNVVILTGGLGPTKDDLTKEACGKVLGLKLVEDPHAREKIASYFKKKEEIPENNWRQALVLEKSKILDNENGLAPGIIVEKNDKITILLPGPPNELIPLFEKKVSDYLSQLQPETILSQVVKICGIGESKVETMIEDLIDGQSNPTIAPYAKTGEVHLRITAKAKDSSDAEKLIKPVVKALKKRFGEAVYSTKEHETLEKAVVKLLEKNDLTLTTAESCTGGLLAGRIINVPGVSSVYKEGFITYSNKSKRKVLDVSKSTLKKHGAVSPQTAKEMAIGGAFATNADCCIAVTGVAGPDGGTEDKPVGLIYIACYLNEKVSVEEYQLRGNREKVREQAVTKALDFLRRCILKNDHK